MSKEDIGEGKGVMSSALLLAAVGVVMVAGMVLKTDPPKTSGLPAFRPPPRPRFR